MVKICTAWVGGAVLAAMLGTLPSTAFAGFEPTSEQRSACMGDTLRLCYSEIPNVNRIVNCLARQKSKVSPRCRVYFDRAGM